MWASVCGRRLTSRPCRLAAGGAPEADEFDQLLSSLCEPSVDSGVDADCSDRSVLSWEPASSDAGSLCSELAGVALRSAPSVSDGWRPVSAPAGPLSTAGSLPTETRSEPDPAALRRAVRHGRLSDSRPLSGLSLRIFGNSESRLECNSRRKERKKPP